jgi:hypothetical protein
MRILCLGNNATVKNFLNDKIVERRDKRKIIILKF